MSAPDAMDALREAERMLVEHRAWLRAREQTPATHDEHERVTQAIHRTREARAHLAPIVAGGEKPPPRTCIECGAEMKPGSLGWCPSCGRHHRG